MPEARVLVIHFYATDDGREPVREWLNVLPRDMKRWIGFMLKEQLQTFGLDVCKTTFGKNLGGDLYEFRLKEDELPTSEGATRRAVSHLLCCLRQCWQDFRTRRHS